MQLILSHGSDIRLKTKENREHQPETEESCGVKNYGKDRHDRDALVSKITAENYADMKKRIGRLSSDFEEIPSTNVLPLFDALDGAGSEWIDSVMEEVRRR
ncbi:MAG: hypothetical protein LUD47_05460 [Clostridia bacterium]|nr:hypothetical protein [Clostridia bacterium]